MPFKADKQICNHFHNIMIRQLLARYADTQLLLRHKFSPAAYAAGLANFNLNARFYLVNFNTRFYFVKAKPTNLKPAF